MQNIDSPIACEFSYKLQMHYKMFDYEMVYRLLGVTFVVVEYWLLNKFLISPIWIIGLELKWLIWQSSWKLYILIQLMIMQLPITCCTMWDANFENKTSNWFSFLKVITIVNFCEVGENKFVSFFCIEISSLHCFWDTFKCVWLPSRVFVVLCEWTWLLDEQLKQCWCLCELEI
jgi:hypothetical protein